MEDSKMTPGQVAVGLKFNPDSREDVDAIKRAMAHVFDLVEQSVAADDGTVETARKRKMRDAALDQIITAQMWAVKVVTLEGK